ncbi:MAG TPA: PspC domain-containing protein [Thermoleophilaceae bacterium]|jgi:signal transduction histidine kinase|nr:PspC domain-containing protein [Thermoleophilaceae bacterium]
MNDQGLRRDRTHGWLGGVCAGIARHYGVDPGLIRLGFVVAIAAGGLGIAAYLLAWLVIPADDATGARRGMPRGRGALETGAGTALLLLSGLLTFRALGLPFSDVVVWPLVLIAGGAALIWRGSAAASPAPSPAAAAAGAPAPDPAEAPAGVTGEPGRTAAALLRTGVGIALVIAAGFAFLHGTHALGAIRDVLLALIAAVVVLGVIFAPWVVRLLRSLTEERAERIRSQERAEVAAHLHDSVLQTLALVQRSEDPSQVAALARRQERELRAWLAGRPAPGQAARLAPALEAAAVDVEEHHGVPVEVVVVGDRDLDSPTEAVVAAAREAMTNAAKFGDGSTVDVYAESTPHALHVFVRDRGPGFDPAAVPDDRRGVRESIVGRMERHGGRALITSGPTGGTEVELVLEDER